MENLDQLDKRIENYLHKRMSESERIAFEDELKSNAELRNNIKALITIIELYSAELFELKEKLDSTEEDLARENFFEGG